MVLAKEVSNWFVCALGIGTVFVSLLCLIVLCYVIGLFCRSNAAKNKANVAAADIAPTAPSAPKVIPNKQELIAAVSAAVAEELGTDVSAIRITSFKEM